MKKSHFIEHYQNELRRFRKYSERTLNDQGMEDVHQLRVSIKKLRAMWSLVEQMVKGRWTSQAHKDLFDKLFHVAGKLRASQMNLKLIEEVHAVYLLPYVDFLVKKQMSHAEKLFEIIETFDHERLDELNSGLYDQVDELTDAEVLENALTYVLEQTSKDGFLDLASLHEIRIHLKEVQEILSIVVELNHDAELEGQLGQIKTLNQNLGYWHDHGILLRSLNNFVDSHGDREFMPNLTKLIKHLETEQETRKQELNALLTSYSDPNPTKSENGPEVKPELPAQEPRPLPYKEV